MWHFRKFVFNIGRYWATMPRFERIGRNYWYAQAFGFCITWDNLPPMTVGQRGVW